MAPVMVHLVLQEERFAPIANNDASSLQRRAVRSTRETPTVPVTLALESLTRAVYAKGAQKIQSSQFGIFFELGTLNS